MISAGDRHWIAMPSDNHDADRFRRQAGLCREKSAKARSSDEAASWLRLAEDLLRLAEDFEKLRGQKRLLSQRLRRQLEMMYPRDATFYDRLAKFIDYEPATSVC